MKIKSRVLSALFIAFSILSPEYLSAQEDAPARIRKLIDIPTCGFLPQMYYELDFKFFFGGGLIMAADFGINDRLNVGLGWGVDHLIDQEGISFFIPGVYMKYLMLRESYLLPAFAIGFDNRPISSFEPDSSKRHYFKSRGIFLAASKNYFLLGAPFGIHGGINYSIVDNKLEIYDYANGDKGENDFFNMFLGFDKRIFEKLVIFSEYDFAMDDNGTHNPLKGYLNFGLRFTVLKAFAVQLDFKDILGNKARLNDSGAYDNYGEMSRELQLMYVQHF